MLHEGLQVDHCPWLWHGRTVSTRLAAHVPVVWRMKWQGDEKIEAAEARHKASIDRRPAHLVRLAQITAQAVALGHKSWASISCSKEPSAEAKQDLPSLHR